MKIAVAYIRCSTDEQTKDSVPRQKNEIDLWVEANGYSVVKYFIDDGVSGTIPLGERPDGRRLIEEIDRNLQIEYVIIWEYSRWGRDADPEQIYYWELYLNQHNVKLISLDNPELTFKGGMERGITRFLQRQTSTQENKSKSLRSYSGGKRNIELGYLNTNSPPFGYLRAAKNISTGEVRVLNEGESIQKKFEKPFLALYPEQAKIAKRIFELRVERNSIRRIAQILNAESIPTAQGKKWRKNVLNRILRNPIYYGAACWNKSTSSRIRAHDAGRRVPKNVSHYTRRVPTNEWVKNDQAGLPAIVSNELWVSANNICLVEQKQPHRPRNSHYLLTGLVYSTVDKCAMVGSTGGRYTRKDGTIAQKRYYLNNNWKSQGQADGVRTIDAQALEDKIVDVIKTNLMNPGLVKRIEKSLAHYLDENRKVKSSPSDAMKLDQEISQKEIECQKLISALKQAPEIDSIVQALRAVEEDLKSLRLRRTQVRETTQRVINVPTRGEIGELVARHLLEFEKLIKSAPMEERRQFIRQWITRIEIKEEDGVKKASLFMRTLPKTPEFAPLEKLCDCGPCRT